MYIENREPTILDRSLRVSATEGWAIYPIWPVDDDGVCLCPKREECEYPGKHPVGPAAPRGFHSASSDLQEIDAMFFRAPRGANAGLATGKASRVVAFDWDETGCGGGMRRLRAQHGHLPTTRMHRTGSGNVQELFALPPHLEALPSRDLPEYGLEILADKAAIVLPPGRTNKGPYEVVIDAPLAPLPDRYVDLATNLAVIEGGGGATESRFVLPDQIYESSPTRNKTLYRYGCSLRVHGWGHYAILAELRRVNAERCVPPMGDDEVQKIARSASRHEEGNATTVTPEALVALADVEAAVLARTWAGVGGKSERSVMIALVKEARRHGTVIPAGVRVGVATRPLAEDSGMPHRSLMRAVKRLRRSGLVRKDDLDRRPAEAWAFVLVRPPTPPARANCHHSPTPPTPSEDPSNAGGSPLVGDDTLRAPSLRWGYSLGKTDEAAIDALERGGGMALEDLAAAGVKRVRDFRRRTVNRLEAVKVVEVKGDRVRLQDGWLEALDRERTLSGEKKAENLERAEHERQREAFKQHLAEKEERR